MKVDDLDWRDRTIIVTGKASKQRRVSIGHKTAQAIERYLRKRSVKSDRLWLGSALSRIATGDVTAEVKIESQDEIGEMARSYGEMREYLVESAEAASRIGNGDLTVVVKPRSAEDALGNAFAQMVENLRSLIGQVRTTAGNLGDASSQLAGAAQQAGQASQGISATTLATWAEVSPKDWTNSSSLYLACSSRPICAIRVRSMTSSPMVVIKLSSRSTSTRTV